MLASGVEALIPEIPTLSEEFQLVVTEDELSRVTLTAQAEAKPGSDPATLQVEAQLLRDKLQTAFGLRMEVEIKSFGELPRWELKARRWLDHRSRA